ncbi:hypothetical protein B296_00047286 [Ensete ventricosum]|uniref:DUF7792 domain-containing protein n=1 Tax=Ensete ventricosum TaxID=4639 RepID=A0A426Z0C7_ENSVE|nr:hypothetical protein B296_00047286 [Ensete ventricosum]
MTKTRKTTGGAIRPSGGGGGRRRGQSTVEEDLSRLITLADRLKKFAADADSWRAECSQLTHRADLIATALRAVARRLSSLPHQPPYFAPVRRVAASADRSLDRAISFARRCRRRRRLLLLPSPAALLRFLIPFAANGAADFRRALAHVDASLADLRWLLSLYPYDDGEGSAAAPVGVGLSLPPIAATDPVLSYVWTCVAAVQMAVRPSDRADAAQFLANLARDGHRNRWLIVDEGGVPPLLALLEDRDDEASQSAAAAALSNLCTDRELISIVADAFAIPVIVQTLSDSTSTRLQSQLASLMSRMAALDDLACEEFARENAILPLVALLSSDVPLGDDVNTAPPPSMTASLSTRSSRVSLGNGGGDVDNDESPAAKLELKTACAEALWMLCKGSIESSRKVAETVGLLCLAKLMETEEDQLQLNCLRTVVEIAAAAESDAYLRGSAFKKNSSAAKPVVEQLLRLAQQGRSPSVQTAAIRAVGSLARTFPAREARVLQPLVAQLGNQDSDVSAEAAMALGKFASSDNYLCAAHAAAIVELEGVRPLMRLLRPGEKSQLPGLVLLCCLASHVPSHEALERERVLLTLESVRRRAVARHPSLKELLPRAIRQLQLYGHEASYIAFEM